MQRRAMKAFRRRYGLNLAENQRIVASFLTTLRSSAVSLTK